MSASRRPSLPPMPDLSHLTEEERKVIEDVLRRQREEEEREQEVIRQMQDEFLTYQQTVLKLSEETRKIGQQYDEGAVCDICHKTKFADGVGHSCYYCHKKSCARCGGRTQLKATKANEKSTEVVWACNLCRKKQELLAKTGAWYHGGMARPVALDVGNAPEGMGVSLRPSSRVIDTSPPNEKKAKMGFSGDTGSGSEKENIDRQKSFGRTSSLQGRELKRQYSMSDAPTSRSGLEGTSQATGTGMIDGPVVADGDFKQGQERGRVKERTSAKHRFHSESRISETDKRYAGLPQPDSAHQDSGRHRGEREQSERFDRGDRERSDRERDRGERERLPAGRSRDINNDRGPGSRSGAVETKPEGKDSRERHREPRDSTHADERDHEGRWSRDRRLKESNSERYRPIAANGRRDYIDKDYRGDYTDKEYRSEKDYRSSREHLTESRDAPLDGVRPERRGSSRQARNVDRTAGSGGTGGTALAGVGAGGMHVSGSSKERRSPNAGEVNDRYKETESVGGLEGDRHAHRILIEHASDTQAAAEDILEAQRMHDRRHLDPNSARTAGGSASTRNNRKKLESMLRNDSLSSDPSDCVRPPPPKPHRHKRSKKQRQQSLSSSDDEIRSTPECSSCEEQDVESESVSEKGKNIGQENREFLEGPGPSHVCDKLLLYDTGRGTSVETESGGSSEPQVKDSGIDTGLSSSSQTLYEEIAKQKHPVTWQPSADGNKWIGHMILKKTVLEGGGQKTDSSAILGLKVIGGTIGETGKLGAFITKVKKGSIADTVGHLRPGDEVVEWNGRSLQGATFEEVYDIILESKQEPQVELIVHRSVKHGEMPPGVQSAFTDHARDYGLRDAIPDHRNQASLSIASTDTPSTKHSRARPHTPQVSGKIQIKLWYDVQSYQLIVTIINAIELPLTDSGKFRNPYCKLYLLPDRSEKSKRRTKTISSMTDPTWNQTFIYCPVKETDLRERLLEITVWDYDRIGASEFLGEVLIDLTSANLNDEPYWYQLGHHDDKISQDPYDVRKNYLSPPVSARGLSDSDMSELDFDDGIGVVSGEASPCSTPLGSEDLSDTSERRRSRRDREGSPRRRSATVVGRDDLSARRRHVSSADKLEVPEHAVQRSRSPTRDSREPQGGSIRSRSRSPAHHRVSDVASRSLSPPDLRTREIGPHRSLPASSRSSGGTPASTPSPKKRQLPAIPLEAQKASRDRVTQDLEERARLMKLRIKLQQDSGLGPIPHSHRHEYESYGSRGIRSGDYLDHHDRPMSHERDRMERSRDRGYDRGRDLERGHRARRNKEFSPDMSDDVGSDNSETSDMSEVSRVSTISVRSTQSERPRRNLRDFTSKMESRTTIPRKQVVRSSSSESQSLEKTDGSVSDSAVSSSVTEGRKRRPSLGHKVASLVGLSRRSSSATQLAGRGGKKRSSFQRSEEIGAVDLRGGMSKQASKDSTDGSIGSISSDSSSVMWLPSGMRLGADGQYGEFVEGLGPSQLVGRQVLGAPCLGEIQLGLYDRKGHLEVEVIRARGLNSKPGARVLPAPYVKVYLLEGKQCLEKQKTTTARRTLDPLYQQQLVFSESYRGRILQVTVWGDYGRMDKKVFMGVAQILLDDLDLSNIVIGWYKLFPTSSLFAHHSSTTGLAQIGLQDSNTNLESITMRS
ncbi:regulating synaptic membrane exocytosis protein 2-like isoform X2 [Pomacea canaliculata]|uniref:regulating synaptic membrane exocytosis protein 2-like isoform X2 n=1 Tax=Pomacea canaliculata TaxID=400727 RepID=UPI000D737794|nr:regulating synaptic membrane exocytosis protein 2-like isoform X2 [Pomacea canaliculata]